MCEQYRSNIEEILKASDLSTITTKKIRRTLEEKTGTNFDSRKKELNSFIEEIFVNFQNREKSPPVVNKTVVTKSTIKKTTASPIKKLIKKKQDAKDKPKVKKPIDWPILKVSPPLSDIIKTNLCSRPQTVKKMWEYIRENKLQVETDKRMINCDSNFKALCDGADQINSFTLQKYLQKCFETIPMEEQAKYKEIVKQQEEH